MVVGTVSGTTTTWGSAVSIESGSTPADDSLRHNSMVWIGGMGGDTTNRLVLVYRDQANDLASRVMTISGTTPTAHAVSEFALGNVPTDHCLAYIGSGKFIVAYNRQGNGEWAIGTVTGSSTNTISAGSYWRFDEADASAMAMQADKLDIANDGTANRVVVAFVDGASSAQRGYVRVGYWDGSQIQRGSAVEFDGTAGTDAISLVHHAGANKMLLFYRPGGADDIVSRSITLGGSGASSSITLGSVTALPNSDSSVNLQHSCANYDPLNKKVLVFRNKGNEYGAWGIAADLIESTITIDLSLGNFFEVDLQNNGTSHITALTITEALSSGKSQKFFLRIIQGSFLRKFVWASVTNVKWPAATGPTLTTTNDAVDILSFTTYDQGTTWYGETVGQNFS